MVPYSSLRTPTPSESLVDGTADDDEGEREYKLCIERIEKELASLAGLTGRQLAEHTGRAEGVGYKWTHASTEQPTGSTNTTAMSMAWRKTAKWLRDLERCRCPTQADGIRWRILHYTHDKPPPE